MTARYTFTPREHVFQTALFADLPFHRRSDTFITPNQVIATSMAAAVAHVRSLRRVRSVPDDGWLVRDAWDEYDHNIILHRIGWSHDAADFEAICKTCPARRTHPCWAVAKVTTSRSYRKVLRSILSVEGGRNFATSQNHHT